MNRERLLGTDLEKPLAEYIALLSQAVEFDSDVDSESSCEASDEESSPRQVPSVHRRVDPNAPSFSEIGRYFSGEITHDVSAALRSAARLGPRRVLALLG